MGGKVCVTQRYTKVKEAGNFVFGQTWPHDVGEVEQFPAIVSPKLQPSGTRPNPIRIT